MLVECILIFVVVFAIYQRWKNREIYRMGRELNSGVWTLPLLGHSYLFAGGGERRMKTFQIIGRDAIKNENGLTSLWHGHYLYTMIADPVAAEFILKTCLQKDDIMKMATSYFGNGSIFAPVSIWKPRRKVLVPTFGPKNMKHFLSIFIKQSRVLVEQLSKAAGTGTISAWKYFTAYTMDAIAEASIGYEMHAQKDSGHPFLKAFDDGLRLSAKRICSPWLHNDLVFRNLPDHKQLFKQKDYLWGFIKELIKSTREQIKQEQKYGKEGDSDSSEKRLQSFLELLIKCSGGEEGYTDIEVIEEIMVIMIAGNDTSAVAASFVSLMLARHPDIQQKVFDELDEVFGESDKPVTSDDLLRLKYLDAVIKETLRLYPPVPVITRKIEQEVVLPSGFKMVPGTGALINIWALHRNPRFWGDDTELFRPERFIEAPLKHPAAFMPFSYGPRNCVGYQFGMTSMKTVMSSVLRRYKFLPVNNTKSYPPLRLKFDLMMKDVDDVPVRLEARIK